MALLTLLEYKVFANIININADARYQVIINAIESWFLSTIKRNIEEDEQDEYYDGDNSALLLLKNYPVTQLDEVSIDDEVIDNNDIYTYPEEGKLRLKSSIFSFGYRNIRVKYSSGYTTVPSDIKMFLAELTSKKYETFDKTKGGSFSNEAFLGGAVVFRDSDITDFGKSVLNRYRKKGKRN